MSFNAAAISTMIGRNISYARCVRFSTIESRSMTESLNLNASSTIQSPVASFGLMLDGCTQAAASIPGNVTYSYSSVTLSFNETLEFNGWWFVTGSDPARDPIRFVLEVSNNGGKVDTEPCGSTWKSAGASWSRWTWAGKLVLKHYHFDTPLDRGKRVTFDYQVLNPFNLFLLAPDPTLGC
jgi:hypothetical protein